MALEIRPNCECCDRDLPPDGGELVRRPIRHADALASAPASTKRVFKPGGCRVA